MDEILANDEIVIELAPLVVQLGLCTTGNK